MFDVSNFVIDRVLRGVMTSTTDGSVMYSVNQIENPQLKCTANEKTAVDALGTPIQTYYNAKQAELSAQNSLFDLGMFAVQQGSEKHVGTTTDKITTPAMESIEVTDTTVTLKHKPIEPITAIYLLNGDDTMGKKYEVGATASATQFAYDEDTYTITLPTEVTVGAQVFVMYEYLESEAVEVVNSAVEFPKAGKFVMEVVGNDVCDPTKLIYAYVIFPNAKLDPNTDVTLSTDGKHPFTMKAQQSYCDHKKVLFRIVIPNLD